MSKLERGRNKVGMSDMMKQMYGRLETGMHYHLEALSSFGRVCLQMRKKRSSRSTPIRYLVVIMQQKQMKCAKASSKFLDDVVNVNMKICHESLNINGKNFIYSLSCQYCRS